MNQERTDGGWRNNVLTLCIQLAVCYSIVSWFVLLIQDETDNLIYESWYVHSSFGREEKHQTARNLSILMSCHVILIHTGTKRVWDQGILPVLWSIHLAMNVIWTLNLFIWMTFFHFVFRWNNFWFVDGHNVLITAEMQFRFRLLAAFSSWKSPSSCSSFVYKILNNCCESRSWFVSSLSHFFRLLFSCIFGWHTVWYFL